MKGLVIKDLIQFKKTLVVLLIIMGAYAGLGIVNGDDTPFFFLMAGMVNMMIPITCAGYDEQCNWDLFGNSLPVSRAKIVLARYITENIIMLATLLTAAVAQIIMLFTSGETLDLSVYVGIIIISLVINGVMNPLVYKFGVQKSRFVLMALCVVFLLLSSVITMSIVTSERDWVVSLNDKIGAFIDTLSQIPGSVIMLILLAIFGGLYALSILLSISIYKKKNL